MKIFKNSIFTFILGLIIAGTIGVVAVNLSANNIDFEPNDENWNVSTVQGALNDLYTKVVSADLDFPGSDNYTTTGTYSRAYVVISRNSGSNYSTRPSFKRNGTELSPISTVPSSNNSSYYQYTYEVTNIQPNESWEFKGGTTIFYLK